MSFSSEIRAKLGLDTQAFTAGLKNASASLGRWTSAASSDIGGVARSVGVLRNLFMLGGALGAARAFFGNAIAHAREYTGAVDEGIEATRRFDASMQSLSVTGARVGVTMIDWIEKASIGLASMIYGTDAAAEALNQLNAEAAAKAAAAPNEKNLRAAADLAKLRRDIAFSEADAYGRLVILINEANNLKQEQLGLAQDSAEWLTIQGKIEKTNAERRKVVAELEKRDFDAARAREDAAADKTTAAEEARAARLDNLRIKRAALVAEAEREAEIEAKIVAMRGSKGTGASGVNAGELDFEIKRYPNNVYGIGPDGTPILIHSGGEPILDENGSPIPINIRSARGGIGPGASFDRGAMFLLGGENTFANPADQATYDASRRASEAAAIDAEIRALEEQIAAQRARMAFGGMTRNYMLDVWQERIYGLQSRKANLDGYLFDPKYSDALGRSIPGQQIEAAGGKLEDYARSTLEELRMLNKNLRRGNAMIRTYT